MKSTREVIWLEVDQSDKGKSTGKKIQMHRTSEWMIGLKWLKVPHRVPSVCEILIQFEVENNCS